MNVFSDVPSNNSTVWPPSFVREPPQSCVSLWPTSTTCISQPSVEEWPCTSWLRRVLEVCTDEQYVHDETKCVTKVNWNHIVQATQAALQMIDRQPMNQTSFRIRLTCCSRLRCSILVQWIVRWLLMTCYWLVSHFTPSHMYRIIELFCNPGSETNTGSSLDTLNNKSRDDPVFNSGEDEDATENGSTTLSRKCLIVYWMISMSHLLSSLQHTWEQPSSRLYTVM